MDPAEDSTLARLEAQLLGGDRTMSLTQLAERAALPVEAVRLFWHAMGHATADPEAPVFTEADAAVLARLGAAVQENELGRETAISLARSVGHLTDRLVLWQAEAIVEHLMHRHSLDDTSARLVFLDRLPEIAPLLEAELVHAWRRQMAALAARFVADFSLAREVPTDGLPLARAVGFADMVSFTIRTAAMPAGELARFVQRFEERSRDVVTTAGGRVVKTIGDAVLFVADDAVTGTEVALGLADEFDASSESPVRVGMVWGRILSRFGDVFGAPVNLAARLTAEADPGTVLTDAETAEALAGDGRYRVTTQPERDVAGLGALTPILLARA